MFKLILFIFFQFVLINVSISQDHLKEYALKVFNDSREAQKLVESLTDEANDLRNKIRFLGKDNKIGNAHNEELREKLFAKKGEFNNALFELSKKNEQVEIAYDSIKKLHSNNSELTILSDSFLVALNFEKKVKQQILNEKNLLEKLFFYKIADLEIVQLENSYISKLSFGYKKNNNEIIYSVNSKEKSKKPIFKTLEYLRYTGNVYVPPGIDTLVGKILIYKDGKLFDFLKQSFTSNNRTQSLNSFQINGDDIKLNKNISLDGDYKIAFVTDDVFFKYNKKLENFYDSYKSALFIVTSIRPLFIDSLDNNSLISEEINSKEIFAIIDTLTTNLSNFNILVCNNLNFSGEYISLLINDSIINNSIKLMPYDPSSYHNYNFKDGKNLIKIKVESVGTNPNLSDCYLWLYISGEGEKIIYKRYVILKKNEIFALYIQNN